MSGITFTRNKNGSIQNIITRNLRGNDVWNKTNKPLPDENGIKLTDAQLQVYEGTYAVSPDFTFTVTKEGSSLYLKAGGQEKIEMFAETPTVFFVKVNDAILEFLKDGSGKVIKALLKQGGRETEAKKIK